MEILSQTVAMWITRTTTDIYTVVIFPRYAFKSGGKSKEERVKCPQFHYLMIVFFTSLLLAINIHGHGKMNKDDKLQEHSTFSIARLKVAMV